MTLIKCTNGPNSVTLMHGVTFHHVQKTRDIIWNWGCHNETYVFGNLLMRQQIWDVKLKPQIAKQKKEFLQQL